jgi:hypothetical protein
LYNGITILKKISPYIFLVFFVLFISLIWDYIKLPFNIEKSLPGEHYLKNFHNPFNDSLRFIIFIFLPLLVYLFVKITIENTEYKIFFSNIFKKFKSSDNHILENKHLNISFYSILLIVLLQFFCLDFKSYLYHLDLFHEGLWLTASSNAIFKNEIWQSSYVGRGLFGSFYNYFMWKILGLNTIGTSRLVSIFLVLLCKVFLILISKNLVEKTFLSSVKKNILFIIFSISLISLFDYNLNAGSFHYRSFGLLFFIFFLFRFFDHFKKLSFSLILVGFSSSLSFFWYIDIGAYINLTIIFLIIYLFLRRDYSNIIYLISYILIGWLIFILILPKNEFIAFYENTISIFSTIEYIQGLIYPTPFFSGDARSTKALLLILITGVFTVNLLFKENDKISIESKISLIFLFLIACINFKTALSRSDTVHIKMGSSFTNIIILYYFLYFVVSKINIEKLILKSNYLPSFFLILFFIFALFNNDEKINIKNFTNSLKSIKYLAQQDDNKFLNKDYIELIDFYKKISIKDKCIQNFTNEAALPYLLKKPTCSKYYFVYTASPKNLQIDHKSSLILSKPEYVIYESELDIYNDPKKRLTIVNTYILNHYTFFQKFKKWTILKIN